MSFNESTAAMVESLPVAFLEQIPGLPPPPGQASTFVDPPNLIVEAAVTISISSFLMVMIVGLRFHSKFSTARVFWWDDFTSFVAMVGSLAYSAVTLDAVSFRATGIHQWNVRASMLISSGYLQEVLFFTAAYTPTVLMAKLSLFILYLRLFAMSRNTKILSWIGIVVCSIFYTFGLIFPLATCSPWPGESRIVAFASDRCAMEKQYGYVTTAFNVFSDFYLVVIPIPVVRSLNMSRDKKIRVCSIFALGILGCVCGIINSYYRVILAQTADTTFYSAPVLLASIVEINVGIIVGCMPLIQTALLGRTAKALRISSIRSLVSRLSFRSRASHRADGSTQSGSEKANGKPYLETGILHGADGKGKFMRTIDQTSSIGRSWFRRSMFGWSQNGTNNETSITSTSSTGSSDVTMAENEPYQPASCRTSSKTMTVATSVSANRRGSDEQDLHKVYLQQAARTLNMV